MAFGGREKHHDFIDLGGQCPFNALTVGREHAQRDARPPFDANEHLGSIPQLRDGTRRDERGDLEMPHAGIDQLIDRRDLGCGRDELRLHLQAIARADFSDRYSLGLG